MPAATSFYRQVRASIAAVSTTLLLALTAAATVVNVEIDPRTAPDPVYSDDNGVFSSSGGTVWNHLGIAFLSDITANNVLDEFGNPTDVGISFNAVSSLDANFRSLEMYSGGGTGTLEISNLSADLPYDLAIYGANPNLSVTVTDLNGMTTRTTGSVFTLELPGDEGEEFALFRGLLPLNLGGGSMGLRIQTDASSAQMAGLQLREAAAIPEPSSLVAFVIWSLLATASPAFKGIWKHAASLLS